MSMQTSTPGRPRGEIRQALHQAAWQLAAEAGGGTWRDIAARACVGYEAARRTIKNMAHAGELQAIDEVRVASSRRPMNRYIPAAGVDSTSDALTELLALWRQS